ncbi:MAG: DUF4142 domain-containing protein [Mucilaginibacter sp.]
MRKLICIVLIIVATQACTDRKGKNHNTKVLADEETTAFLNAASESGLTEIEASGLAQSRSKNPRVVKFAGMLIDHHTAIGEELHQIESDLMVDQHDTMSVDKQEAVAALSEKTGPEFDKAYITMMVDGHNKAVQLFEKGTASKGASVSSFAKKNLPMLKTHLDSAKAINASLK